MRKDLAVRGNTEYHSLRLINRLWTRRAIVPRASISLAISGQKCREINARGSIKSRVWRKNEIATGLLAWKRRRFSEKFGEMSSFYRGVCFILCNTHLSRLEEVADKPLRLNQMFIESEIFKVVKSCIYRCDCLNVNYTVYIHSKGKYILISTNTIFINSLQFIIPTILEKKNLFRDTFCNIYWNNVITPHRLCTKIQTRSYSPNQSQNFSTNFSFNLTQIS